MQKIYYIGDSTVAFNKIHTYPQTGISQGLPLYLKEDVQVISLAKNGRSTKSFLDEGLFVPVQQGMGQGDFLFIQFGHNDEKDDPARHTDANGSFRDNLRYFINEARKRGAYPILITPIARRLFNENGQFKPGSHGAYPEAVRQVGAEENVPVADLTDLTENYLAQLGDEASKPLFVWPKDNTHLKAEGAVKMAGFLAAELDRFGGVYADLLEKEWQE
jgi:lysophospholipase L1-like esterase